MNKMREYERGREDGLLLAQKIVKEGGLEALNKEIKFRGCTGIHTSLACKDLDKASERIKEIQGLLLKKDDAVDEGYLYDWYIHSTSDDEPIWTEAHIEELFNDFILIPKEEAEAALAEMEK